MQSTFDPLLGKQRKKDGFRAFLDLTELGQATGSFPNEMVVVHDVAGVPSFYYWDDIASDWVLATLGITVSPAGNDTEVQFNDGGDFGSDSTFTFNKTTKALGINSITYNTAYSITGSEPTGTTYRDSDNKTLSTVIEFGAILQHGFELYKIGTDNGNDFPEGRAVSVSGTNGNRVEFVLTDASSTSTNYSSYIGLLTTDPLSTNRVATREGAVNGLNTTGSGTNKLTFSDEVWAEDDKIRVDPVNPGYLTNVQPNAPDNCIRVGSVTIAHINQGQIELLRQIGQRLVDLCDVNGTPLTADGQLMVWDNTNKFFDATKNINDYETIVKPIKTITATTYTILLSDSTILLDGTSNTVTATLPTAVGNEGQIFKIVCINDTNSTKFKGNGTETISGTNEWTMTLYEAREMQSNGAERFFIS